MLMVKEEGPDAAFIQKNGKTFDVVVDEREQGHRIPARLEEYFGARVSLARLPYGSFLVEGDICIKRFTAQEFIRATIRGGIFQMAAGMNEAHERALIIIEGDLETTGYKVHPHAVKGALTSLTMRWNMPVLFARDSGETVLLLWLIGTQEAVARSAMHKRHGGSPKDPERQRLYVLQGLSDVGPALAARIMEHFGSLRAFINASVEELEEVKGIGSETAQQIHDVVAGND
ncbi:ERCC4 domain-containing protein [Planctomycetota bacterium]